MKVLLAFLLLLAGFSFDLAGKCDSYFVGNVNYRRRSHGFEEIDNATIQGCVKGCFWNETYTDDGAPKCEKCSNIEDEVTCLSHTATCLWTKSGKCTTQNCPGIAKARITLNRVDNGEIDDNSTGTRESLYRDQVKKEQECIEGSALEQKYNNLYWNDYNTAYNYQYAIWNTADTCTVPGYTFGSSPYGWSSVRGGNAAANAAACNGYFGYTYIPGVDTNGAANPGSDQCIRISCTVTEAFTDQTEFKTICRAKEGCIYIRGYAVDGTQDLCESASANDVCTRDIYGGVRWWPGYDNAAQCETDTGCVFIRGRNNNGVNDYIRDINGLQSTDQCVPGCSPFTPGTDGRKVCEKLGCRYAGGDTEEGRDLRPGVNLRTFQDQSLCPDDRHPPYASRSFCGVNTTLALNRYTCDDRIYSPGRPFSCSIESLTTEEACKSGHGMWTAPPDNCRQLPSTTRSICEFNVRDRKNEEVWEKNLTHHGGNRRPGTAYERCVQDHYDELDQFIKEEVMGYNDSQSWVAAYVTPADHERMYGYRTPEEYCGNQMQLELQSCQRIYDNSVAACHVPVDNTKVTTGVWTRNSIDIKAARSACHRIYRCMYSKSNERCSYWSIWAFILTLILVFVVFFVVVVVGVLVLLPKIRKGLGSAA